MKKWLLAFLLPGVALAQPWNSTQPFQPYPQNFVVQNAGGYTYGWPACGTCEEESGVVLQYVLDETTGNIVDEVDSFSMAPTGAINYEEAAAGLWGGVSPGLSAGTTTSRFYGGLTSDAYALGTGDFVLESVISIPVSADNYQWVFGTGGPTFGQRGFGFWNTNQDGEHARLELMSTDLTVFVYAHIALDKDYRDGDPHKWRWYGTVAGDIDLAIDGVSQGTFDSSALSGKTVGSYFAYLLGWGNAENTTTATVYEVRLTVGNKTNCSNSGGDC